MEQETNFYLVFYPLISMPSSNDYLYSGCQQSHTNVSEETIFSQSNNNNDFWKLFEKQVETMNEKFEKKVWTEEEDLLLVRLREEGHNWRSIAKIIKESKDQICKRRYQKIKIEQKNWPKEIDRAVKYLYEVEKLSWPKIFTHLRSKFNIVRRKKLQKIRTRYRLYLSSNICKEQWSFCEDCFILDFVNQKGNKWRDLSLIFQNRTELQLKNRYYGTLRPIEMRVLKKMKQQQNHDVV